MYCNTCSNNSCCCNPKETTNLSIEALVNMSIQKTLKPIEYKLNELVKYNQDTNEAITDIQYIKEVKKDLENNLVESNTALNQVSINLAAINKSIGVEVTKQVNAAIVVLTADIITRQSVKKGATTSRPTSPFIGQQYLDTSLLVGGMPIQWNGIDWVDAMGMKVF